LASATRAFLRIRLRLNRAALVKKRFLMSVNLRFEALAKMSRSRASPDQPAE
jgi:hypothetical protein